MSVFRTLAALAIVAVTASAQPIACNYDLYRPPGIEPIVRQTLRDAGIALLGNRELVTGAPAGALTMLRDGLALGAMYFNDDVRSGTSALVLSDAEDRHFFEMREKTYLCPPDRPLGRCKLTEITTELDQLSWTPPAFALQLDPQGFLHYYRYGNEVLPQDWRGQLGETMRWMQNVLTHPRLSRAIVAPDSRARIFYALASNPVVAPYADRLRYWFDGTYWVVWGTVPSDLVYGAVIDSIRAAGYPFVNPEMIIDTRTALPALDAVPLYREPEIAACFL